MNNSQVAKNGFKTFLVTLVASLVLFSVLYYFLAGSSKTVDIENKNLKVAKTNSEQANVVASTAAVPAAGARVDDSAAPDTDTTSAFATLSQQRIDDKGRVVLAATTESTSSVPVTGVTEITWGVIMSLLAISFGAFLVFKGPRKAAISEFEKDITKHFD